MMAVPTKRAFAWSDPRRAGGRVFLPMLCGVVLYLLLPSELGPHVRIVAAWDAAGATSLALAWLIITRSDAATTHRRAAADDPGRTMAWLTVLAASTFSVFAGAVVIRQARALSPQYSALLAALCLCAVVTSWLMLHTAYTLRYAHLYYRDDTDGVGGLAFPSEPEPDLFDFAYFAFTVGMCFQVSDVCVTSRQFRRTVLAHAVLAFAYNTVIVALALNLAFGLLG